MNDVLNTVMQTKYRITESEVIDRIEQAKEQGKIIDLYECMLLKLRSEKNGNVIYHGIKCARNRNRTRDFREN